MDLVEALCGFQRPVQHLDGRTIAITSIRGEIVRPGSIKVVRGAGMPIHRQSTQYGDLYIVFKVGVLNKAQRQTQNKVDKDMVVTS